MGRYIFWVYSIYIRIHMYTCINELARVIWPATFARSAGPPGGGRNTYRRRRTSCQTRWARSRSPNYSIYTCIHMYVYTWSKLAYCESNNASHGNDKRGYREATETPREATEAPRRPRRSPLSPTKATEIIAKTALQIPAF